MANLTWSGFAARSANLAGTALDSLANGGRSTAIVYNNTLNYPYGMVTIKLGSLFPSTNSGIGLAIRGTDGTDTATFTTPQYVETLANVSGAAVVVFKMVSLQPGNNNFIVLNLSEVSLAASGNEFYVTPYTEVIT